jgi:hypothetical protein
VTGAVHKQPENGHSASDSRVTCQAPEPTSSIGMDGLPPIKIVLRGSQDNADYIGTETLLIAIKMKLLGHIFLLGIMTHVQHGLARQMLRPNLVTHRAPPDRVRRRTARDGVASAIAPANALSAAGPLAAGAPIVVSSEKDGTGRVDRPVADLSGVASAPPVRGKGWCSACTTPSCPTRGLCANRRFNSRNASQLTAGDVAEVTRQQATGSNIHCGTSSKRAVSNGSSAQRKTVSAFFLSTVLKIHAVRPHHGCQR